MKPSQLKFCEAKTSGENDRSVSSLTLPEYQPKLPANRKEELSVLMQSFHDFSFVLRKEYKRPTLPPVVKSSSRLYEINARLTKSKSLVPGEKKGGGMSMTRKTYVNMDELEKFPLAAANAIKGENRGKIVGNGG
ncbi:hypothetical protein OSB04_un000575 [Centaurea solstitialis]|uniref:Uncharacterized protein n=1 Tax=Centaurea solstitialis TaxID=347529 RepID=A0AA38VRQ8_9ASTR|nr:hypothetical protein OSB04_un000575 [Centaurea solstitialis]